MSHAKSQADPEAITWHEGNVWMPDANTPNAETSKDDDNPLVSGINLLAKVGIQIGKAADQMEKTSMKMGQMARALERNTPIDTSIVASGVAVTSTPLVLNLGQPDQGTVWELSSFAIGGTEINVTAAGTWGLYLTGLPTLAGAGLGNLVDVGISSSPGGGIMPAVYNYSSGQVVAHDTDNIIAIIFGGTNAQTYVANIQMRVYNVIASQGQVTYGV